MKFVPNRPTPLFESEHYYARGLSAPDIPLVQALFEANPEYFFSVNGRGPMPDEARREFDEFPPAHLSFSKRWFAGLFNRSHALEGIAVVVSDLSAPKTWHISFFLISTARRGAGAGSEIYAAMEGWAVQSGAKWMRLGVVQGNPRAERFWHRHGFQEVRVRTNLDTGGKLNTVRVLVKPLMGAGLHEYLELVPRDRRNSPLP